MITVFTPVYNRGNLLPVLYKSLCSQTFKEFEWVIVDDGSTDNTSKVVQGFLSAGLLRIKYFKQKNGGKHAAINRGVQEASYEIFIIVDSDDYILNTSLERISILFKQVENDDTFAGIAGLMSYPTGRLIGSGLPFDKLAASALDIRMKWKVSGDLCEVFKTKVLKEFPFPTFEDERFCPEALVWNRIAQKYNLLYLNEVLYVRDYLDGGLTSKIVKIRMTNPKASLLHYSELYKYRIPLIQKVKAGINFWRFAFSSKEKFLKKVRMIGWSSIFEVPFGFMFYLKDRLTVK